MARLRHERLKAALAEQRFEWRKHVLERMATRGLSQAAVLEAITTGEMIEHYSDDEPYPSALFLGWVQGEPLHVVAAFDEASNWAYIITAYRPDEEYFEADFRTRRKRP